MSAVLRWTGIGKLISFYRHIQFSAPWTTTGSASMLVCGIGAIHLYLLSGNFGFPTYLNAYFALLSAAALLSAVGMLLGRRPGWGLGSLVALAAIAVYVASRTLGLPGLPELVSRWDDPLGTFSLALAVLLLFVHVSVVTGMNVAVPRRRDWHD
ncbi:hypothetical protein DFQ14_102275 [Halopolyspora algeriensis]|uniref:Uncharacterized protein n=1 Tax=Halopolyspora algeriensis TaxID=1500506 RepID=A0A368VVV6_9ACTN|nr:oxidoreductase [Halopolyspora algeriensis]RCW45973.1 hypothetical protein DFQ14_102275 [Halopolyspora algeriensis]TQM55386.1 hypothetical protein FHU43_0149 [Halopolyspora algeriensis]